jgi:putative NIF3 family GTP cyclohydrolase 1 type 2
MEGLQRQLEAAKIEAERVKAAAERAKRNADEKANKEMEVILTHHPVTHSKSAAAPKQNTTSPSQSPISAPGWEGWP